MWNFRQSISVKVQLNIDHILLLVMYLQNGIQLSQYTPKIYLFVASFQLTRTWRI